MSLSESNSNNAGTTLGASTPISASASAAVSRTSASESLSSLSNWGTAAFAVTPMPPSASATLARTTGSLSPSASIIAGTASKARMPSAPSCWAATRRMRADLSLSWVFNSAMVGGFTGVAFSSALPCADFSTGTPFWSAGVGGTRHRAPAATSETTKVLIVSPSAMRRRNLFGRCGSPRIPILPESLPPTMGRRAGVLTFAATGPDNNQSIRRQDCRPLNESLMNPFCLEAGRLHGSDTLATPDSRMAAIGPSDHLGRRSLHPALAMVGARRRRGRLLVEVDSRAYWPLALGSGTDRMLLLHDLGGLDYLEPIRRGPAAAARAGVGTPADRRRRPHPARRRPAARAETRCRRRAARTVYPGDHGKTCAQQVRR